MTDMSETKLPRDEDGEVFQDEFTENESEAPVDEIEEAAHKLHGDPDIDSQAGDDFMRKEFEKKNP
jgi:hypothetical protein